MKRITFPVIAVLISMMLTACGSSSDVLKTQESNEKQNETAGNIEESEVTIFESIDIKTEEAEGAGAKIAVVI